MKSHPEMKPITRKQPYDYFAKNNPVFDYHKHPELRFTINKRCPYMILSIHGIRESTFDDYNLRQYLSLNGHPTPLSVKDGLSVRNVSYTKDELYGKYFATSDVTKIRFSSRTLFAFNVEIYNDFRSYAIYSVGDILVSWTK